MKTHTFTPYIFALSMTALSVAWAPSALAEDCDANGSICKSTIQELLQQTRATMTDARKACKAQNNLACKPIYMEADKKCQKNWGAYGFTWTPPQDQGGDNDNDNQGGFN